jgi:hypothetical protein
VHQTHIRRGLRLPRIPWEADALARNLAYVEAARRKIAGKTAEAKLADSRQNPDDRRRHRARRLEREHAATHERITMLMMNDGAEALRVHAQDQDVDRVTTVRTA